MLQNIELSSGISIERYLLEIADQAQTDGNLEKGCYAIARLYAILDARDDALRSGQAVHRSR